MSDLISREALVDDIFNMKCLTEKSKEWFAEIVKKQPSAYDVDRVLEQLKEISKTYCVEYNQEAGSLYFPDAVEIVKEGGVE